MTGVSAYYNEIDEKAAAWLRGYGNAVDAVATKNFIEAFGEALDETFYGRDRVGLTPAIEGG